MTKLFLLHGDLLQPLDHAEHDSHGDEAYHHEYEPAHPLTAEAVVHQRADPDEEVADCCSAEPQTLADTLQVLGSHLRYEGQSEGRDEQLSHSEEEVCDDQHPGSGLDGILSGYVPASELLAGGIAHNEGEDGEEEVGNSGYEHTDSDLPRSGDILASSLPESGEYPHHDRSEGDNEERVHSLPDLGSDGLGGHEVTGKH